MWLWLTADVSIWHIENKADQFRGTEEAGFEKYYLPVMNAAYVITEYAERSFTNEDVCWKVKFLEEASREKEVVKGWKLGRTTPLPSRCIWHKRGFAGER